MSEFINQFDRVKRFLKRIENQDRDATEYDDDLWSFFKNCHHLRDWIKNDSDIGSKEMKNAVKNFIRDNEYLTICADLACRTKHLKLTRKNSVDAKITSRSVTIYVPTVEDGTVGTSTCEHIITLGNGDKYVALNVARKAVAAWEYFLSHKGLI